VVFVVEDPLLAEAFSEVACNLFNEGLMFAGK